jgi:hypothetical protein
VLEFSRLIWSNCSSIHQDEHSRAQVAGVSSQSEQIRLLLLEKAMAHCVPIARHVTWHVTLDTVCHWTLPCKLVSSEFRLSSG